MPGIDQSSDLTWTHSKYGQIVVSDQSSDKNRIQSEFEQTWTQSEFGQNLDTIRVRTNLVHTVGYRPKKINVVTGQSSEKTWHRARVRKDIAAFRETLF